MWGLGILWAITAPLLLLVPVALLVVLLSFTGWSRYTRMAISAGLVIVTVGTIWWLDFQEFVSVCNGVGKPRIFMYATADGIYLDSPTANSFGMNYLHEQGFAWMEMRDIHDHNKIERVTREPNGQIRTQPSDTISARYEVRETFEHPYRHTGLSMKRVIDRKTGTVMAQAGSASFDGGRMQWVLGVYGTRSCPNAMTDTDDFRTYYYLAQRTLRPAKQ
jgi:hypothetical protein